MRAQKIKNLLSLWNSQGLFQGDINRVQQFCKSFCLGEEGERQVDILKINTLASNPEIYQVLFEPLVDHSDEGEWQTLAGEQESDILAEFERWERQREES